MKASLIRRNFAYFLENRSMQFAARLVLGSVFLIAGIAKIASPKEFAEIVINYGLLPKNISIYLAFILPWIEELLGIFLILGIRLRETSLAISFLLLVFCVAVLNSYFKNGMVNCGCFSVNKPGSESVIMIVLRDVVFLACALCLFASTSKVPAIERG